MVIRRGDVWWVNFGDPFGSEPGFRRPALVLQSDVYNRSRLRSIIVVPLTSNPMFQSVPGNVGIPKGAASLGKESVAVGTLIAATDRSRFIKRVGTLPLQHVTDVEDAVRKVLSL